MPLRHHELCFGCGRSNLFGLLGELERRADGSIAGRCFVKQDHQGPEPGSAHGGVVVSALLEAMSFASHGGRLSAIVIEFDGLAPVGGFLELEAAVDPTAGGRQVSAAATSGASRVARATASVAR